MAVNYHLLDQILTQLARLKVDLLQSRVVLLRAK
jgi:hypothetical protein